MHERKEEGECNGRSQSSLELCTKQQSRGVATVPTNPARCVAEPAAGHQLCALHSPRHQKLDTPPQPARQQPQPRSDSSSDSDETTEEEEEEGEGRTEMRKPGSGRGHVYDLDTGHDLASEEQAEDDLATPGGGASASVGTGHTVYMQVNFSLQVSPFNQYTFPSPPTSRPIYHPGCLVAPNGGYYWGARTAAHGQRTVALSMSLEMKEFILQLPSLGHE